MASRKYRRPGQSTNLLPIIVGTGILLLASAIVGFLIYKGFDKGPSINKVTLCPDKVPEVISVLVDASDDLSAIQRADIQNRLDEVIETLPQFGRIDLYGMGIETDGIPRPLFSMCSPGTGEHADALTQNARLMRRKFKRDFGDKLAGELQRAMQVKHTERSPIMEAIKAVGIQSFGGTTTRDADKSLVIISDMIHYTDQLNQYTGGPSVDFGKFERSEYYRQIRTELRGVEVSIYYIRRSTQKNVQNPKHLKFWELFFRESGGRVIHFAPI